MGFLAALKFLTILPIPSVEFKPVEIGKALSYFPLVGLFLGLIMVALDRVSGLVLPPFLTNSLLVMVLVLLTGALHMDGLMDTCDGLAGAKSSQERLEIMEDSRVGGLGVLGALCVLLIKFAALNSLPGAARLPALILMPALGRWAMVIAIFSHPYAKPTGGLGKTFRDQVSLTNVLGATAVVLISSLLLLRLHGLIVMAGVFGLTLALAWYLHRKLSGLTGDTYGAINEAMEALSLILIPLAMGGYGMRGVGG